MRNARSNSKVLAMFKRPYGNSSSGSQNSLSEGVRCPFESCKKLLDQCVVDAPTVLGGRVWPEVSADAMCEGTIGASPLVRTPDDSCDCDKGRLTSCKLLNASAMKSI